MFIYLFIYILLLFFTLKEVIKERFTERQIKYLFLIFLFLFSTIAGIRFGVGKDYFTYLDIFHGIKKYSDYNYLEPGFRLIISSIKELGFNDLSLFFIFALISLTFSFKGIKENSKYPVFSIFIFIIVFYIGYCFNVLRQGIVMSLFLFLLKDIEQRNFKKVLLFSFLGMSIHYSGILILISYFFYNIKINRKMYIVLAIFLIALMTTNSYWSQLLVNFAPEILQSKISAYMKDFKYGVDFIGILQRVLLLIPFLWFYNSLKESDASFEGRFKIYFLGLVLYAVFSFQGMLATRLNMFFRILEVILLPYLLEVNTTKFKKYLIFALIIVWATLLYVNDLRQPANFPFKTIFSI